MFEIIQAIFTGVWNMFSIPYPGFEFSIATVLIGALCAVMGLRILGNVFGFSFGVGGILNHVKGGNNRKIKVNEKRKRDKL